MFFNFKIVYLLIGKALMKQNLTKINININIIPRVIINRNIYLFTYNLLKIIFISHETNKFSEDFDEKEKKIDLFSFIANNKILNRKSTSEKSPNNNYELTTDYTNENMDNIFYFISNQNIIYVGEILDNIISEICSFAMTIKKEYTINEYIFENLKNVDQLEDLDKIRNWIDLSIFKNDDMKMNLNPPFESYIVDPFCYLLFNIFENKFDSINKNKEYNDYDIIKYFNNNYYDGVNNYYIDIISKTINDQFSQEIIMKDISNLSSLMNIHHLYMMIKSEFDKIKKICSLKNMPNEIIIDSRKSQINIFQYFFYTLFIYSKIKNSILMEYTIHLNDDKIVNIPFEYNFDYGYMCPFYSTMITAPLKYDKRIKKISFKQNNIADLGIFGIGKAIALNLNFEVINLDKNLTRSYYLEYLIFPLRIFKNYNLKEISLNSNIYLKEDIDDFLCEIINHFKSLKKLNISNNQIKSGITKFCIQLKELYRLGECELEELNLNRCKLDESSLYELSEMIKCKYCKLKYLILNKNNLNKKFFKCLKKNTNLNKLILYKCNINNNMVKEINKMISLHKSLKSINIGKNNINSSNELLRIIARTKLIDSYKNVMNTHICDSIKDLDLNQNKVDYLQKNFIINFKEIAFQSNLLILDFSKIFLEGDTNYFKVKGKESNKFNKDYVNFLNKYLRKEAELRNDEKKICKQKISQLKNNIIELENQINDIEKEENNFKNIFESIKENNEIIDDKQMEIIIDEKINEMKKNNDLQRTGNNINDNNQGEKSKKLLFYLRTKYLIDKYNRNILFIEKESKKKNITVII